MYKAPTVVPVDWWAQAYTVIDFETTIRNTGEDAIGSQSGSPFHPNNVVHLYGSTRACRMRGLLKDSFFEKHFRHKSLDAEALALDMESSSIIVGQNFKFDLLYMLTHHKQMLMDFLRKGGIIWDTMQAEYLLTNQQEQFAPLGNKYKKVPTMDAKGNPTGIMKKVLTRKGMAEKYGGTDKDDRIAEYWNNGIDTPEIPIKELDEYLDGDLRNTSIVFREQFRLSLDRGPEFMNLVQTQMQAIVATTFAEYNGMKFNIDRAGDEAVIMAEKHDKMEIRLRNYMADEINIHGSGLDPDVLGENCNPGSVQQLSTMFFGGVFKHTKRMVMKDDEGNDIFIKSGPNKGTPKMKNFEICITIEPGSALGRDYTEGLEKNTLGYIMDDAACQGIIDNIGSTTVDGTFLRHVLKYRKLGKDLKTYYIGLMNLTWPTDSCIHGSMNHCSTGTGRLSSSAPNMQNVSG